MALGRRAFVRGAGLWLLLSAGPAAGWAQTLQWSQDYHSGDGRPDTYTEGPHLAVDAAGAAYAASRAFNGTAIGLLVKYSATGDPQWSRIVREGSPRGLTVDAQGRLLLLTQLGTVAHDAAGAAVWRARHSALGRSLDGVAIEPMPEGGSYVAGDTWAPENGRPEIGLMRLDDAGRVAWLATQPAPLGTWTQVVGLEVDRAGRAYVAGVAREGEFGPATPFVVAFSPDGAELWTRWLPAAGADDRPVVAADPNGGAYVSLPGGPVEDFQVLKLDPSGATRWSTPVSASLAGFGKPFQAVAAPDGGLLVVGSNQDYAVLARLDATGRRRWSAVHPADNFGVEPTPDLGGVAVDDTGRVVLTWTHGNVPRVAAYEPSGALAWRRDDWGTHWTGDAWAYGALATANGRVHLLVQRGLANAGTQFTVALGAGGALEFAASPPDLPSADWAWAARLDPLGNALVLATGFDGSYRDRLLKYSPSGGLSWVGDPFAGQGVPWVHAFDVGPAGEAVVVGSAGAGFGVPLAARLEADGSRSWLLTDVLPATYDAGAATAVAVDADGSAYVAGWALQWGDPQQQQPPLQQLFLCKYGRNGELLWRRLDAFPDSFALWPVRIAVLTGGRVAVGGTAWLRGQGIASPRIWVVDAAGADVWSAMPGIPRGSVTVTALVAASDGALLVGTDGPPGRVYKLSAAGALEWVRQAAKWDQWGVNTLAVDPGGDVLVAYQAPHCLLHRLSPAGEILWARPAGDPDVPGYCAALGARAGGGTLASGAYFDGFDQGQRGFLAAYDTDGQLVWERKLAAAAGGTSAFNALAVGPSGRVAVVGYAFRGATDYDAVVQDVRDEPPASQSFYSVAPCRALDTRDARPGGPAAITAGAEIEVPLAGRCGVPASARSVAVNLTVVAPGDAGHLTAYPAGRVGPRTSVLNYRQGVTRASLATLGLGDGGRLTLRPVLATGSVHLLLDVAGYFE